MKYHNHTYGDYIIGILHQAGVDNLARQVERGQHRVASPRQRREERIEAFRIRIA